MMSKNERKNNSRNEDLQNNDKIKYKVYKTIDEQIEYLKNNKKVNIDECQKYILEERNYISIINPYKEFFATGHIIKEIKDKKIKFHIYKNETDISQFKKMSEIDDEISKYLYNSIGVFERKFKNILIQEMCGLYNIDSEKDIFCINYIEDIQKYITNDNEDNKPRFCANICYIIIKDKYVYDEFHKESRMALLKKIQKIRLGLEENTKNQLISHYVKQQQKVPLWAIPNALTLGELNILFSMLDNQTQRNVINRMLGIKSTDIRIRDIVSFQGYLEIFRRVRNVINHYEPIIPLFVNIKDKKIKDCQIIKTLVLLQKVFRENSAYIPFIPSLPEILVTEYNSKKIRILQTVIGIIK